MGEVVVRVTDGGVHDDRVLLQENEDLRERDREGGLGGGGDPTVSLGSAVCRLLGSQDRLPLGSEDVT